MAWATPSSRTTGTLMTAAIWNSDAVDNPIALRAGAIAIASQAALDFLYASSATQFARLAKGTALQVPRINAAADGYEFFTPSGVMTLLVADSGTTTNTSAEDVDTIAITGLTAKDALLVHATGRAVTQGVAAFALRNTTDSVNLSGLGTTSNLAAGEGAIVQWNARQRQDAATAVHTLALSAINSTWNGTANQSTFTQAWTGSWTLGLHHDGVTSGGTFQWSWAVFKVAGQ